MFNNSISAIVLLLKLYHTLLLLLPKYSITLVLFLTYSSIPLHHLQIYFPPQSNSESLTLYNEMTKIVFALCKVNWFLTLIKLLCFFYDCYLHLVFTIHRIRNILSWLQGIYLGLSCFGILPFVFQHRIATHSARLTIWVIVSLSSALPLYFENLQLTCIITKYIIA